MILGPGTAITGDAAPTSRIRPKFILPQLSLPINKSYLHATAADINSLHSAMLIGGFTLVGFHGCGSDSAKSILCEIKDVSTTNARGKGFAVGNIYTGIPKTWSVLRKSGNPTILRIYVKEWTAKSFGLDYDWGKMDPDDNISKTGLEMVLRTRIFSSILALPSLGVGDQSLLDSSIWKDCPTHSFRPYEVENMKKVAAAMKMDLHQLEEYFLEMDDTKRKKIKEVYVQLGIPME
jgi:hypothetical protein